MLPQSKNNIFPWPTSRKIIIDIYLYYCLYFWIVCSFRIVTQYLLLLYNHKYFPFVYNTTILFLLLPHIFFFRLLRKESLIVQKKPKHMDLLKKNEIEILSKHLWKKLSWWLSFTNWYYCRFFKQEMWWRHHYLDAVDTYFFMNT